MINVGVKIHRLLDPSLVFVILILLVCCACGGRSVPVSTPTRGITIVVPWTETPKPTHTPIPPPFQLDQKEIINPLTGLFVSDPRLLARRPILVKVENLPRDHRPQFGLSLADIVFEYHTEEGTTRFAALFYGQDAEKVGPIRSARYFDIRLMEMYKPIFVFGSAFRDLLDDLFASDFKDRLVLEGPNTSPALFRFEPDGKNLLMLSTIDLNAVIDQYDIDNDPPQLKGMYFDDEISDQGKPAEQIFTRYSSAIYNRWDYISSSGRYQRFVDADNASSAAEETYAPLSDRLTDQPVAAENVVIVLAENVVVTPGVFDVLLTGKGEGYIARDGQLYKVFWVREEDEDVLTLIREDGSAFPFKPGQTWFEVMSLPNLVKQEGDSWRFTFTMPGE